MTTFQLYNKQELVRLYTEYLSDMKEEILDDTYQPMEYEEFCTKIQHTPLRSIFPDINWAV